MKYVIASALAIFAIGICAASGSASAVLHKPMGNKIALASATADPAEPTNDSGAHRSGTRLALSWRSSWGAIAANDKNDVIGIAKDKGTRRRAEKAALADCAEKAKEHCEIRIAYFNQCAAIAVGSRGGAYALSAKTQEEATAMSLKKCEASEGAGCETRAVSCSVGRYS